MGRLIIPGKPKPADVPIVKKPEAMTVRSEPPELKVENPVVKFKNPTSEQVKIEPAEGKQHLDSSTVIQPVLRDSREAFERVNEFLCESNERVIQIRESDLKRLITDIISECDAHYVKRSDLKAEVEKVLQSMVKHK